MNRTVKICGIPIPTTEDKALAAPTLRQTAVVHAVDEGAPTALCGVATNLLETWDETFPGKRFPDVGRCEKCRTVVSKT